MGRKAELHSSKRISVAFWGGVEYKYWSRIIRARIVTPRHATIAWFVMHQKLSVRCRTARFTTQNAE